MILDLDALRDEANRWLLAQRADRALCPCAISYFRSRFCLPSFIVDAVRREGEKERGDGA